MAQYQKKKLRKSHEVFFRGPSLTYHNHRTLDSTLLQLYPRAVCVSLKWRLFPDGRKINEMMIVRCSILPSFLRSACVPARGAPHSMKL